MGIRFMLLILCVLSAVLSIQAFAVEADDIVIDGNFKDWEKIPVSVEDPEDQANNPSGDYKALKVATNGNTFCFLQIAYGEITPLDGKRYYYHVLIDVDNKVNTGISNKEYEGKPTKVKRPIGSEFYIQIGRDKGQVEFGSNYALHLETEEILSKDFEWKNNGDSLELAIPFKDFGKYAGSFKVGQTISIAAFQEGEANGWAIDWTESAEHEIGQAYVVQVQDKLPLLWAELKTPR